MNKKGFTLAETLAVIAIVAILGLITIPAINKSLEKNKKKAFTETIDKITEAVKIYRATNDFSDEDEIYDIVNNEYIEYTGKNKVKSGKVRVDDDTYIIEYVTNGEYCAYGLIENLSIGKTCSDIDITIPIVASTQLRGRILTLEIEDGQSGIGAYCITTTNDSDSCTWQDTTETTIEETLTTSGTYFIFAKDKKDNISEGKRLVTGDIEEPTIPTSGSIGIVSGSDTTGTIQNPASGSTDESEITYKYLVTNTNTKPDKYDTNFTTSLDFARTCGTLYYGWAVAEDTNGYRSEVYALGSTQDGTDSYSDWGACSKACGTGTQTKTNSCQLITEEISQSCNTQECCSSTNYTASNGTWGACSKTCGGGTQTYYETRTYTSAYDGSACGVTNSVNTGTTRSCNTQACCAYAVNTYWDYNYTGGVQSFPVPCNGTYQLQVYGGSGQSGLSGGSGGYGGYSVGNKALTAGQVLYVVVGGGNGNTYNGGGTGKGTRYPDSGCDNWGGNGGGATDIRLGGQALGNRIIVAGGGGGGGGSAGWNDDGSSCYEGHNGGAGGGTNGGAGQGNNSGGTQSGGNALGSGGSCAHAYGGAGGGYYGGRACGGYSGGGGSGYIGGVTSGSMSNGQRAGNGFARITLKAISN